MSSWNQFRMFTASHILSEETDHSSGETTTSLKLTLCLTELFLLVVPVVFKKDSISKWRVFNIDICSDTNQEERIKWRSLRGFTS